MLEIGSLVDGKYKILNQVGHGGMSVVYLAMNEKANKQWAIKEVRKDGIKDFEVVKQSLVAETDMLKKLNHPNLPSIIDVIENEDHFLIVMDYIQGNSLEKKLNEFGAQPQEEVIAWAKQLCDVLGYLHSRNPAIIYRDMKPANIMLKPDGNVTLIDFGTAREFKEKNLADTTCLGTIGYAAPEQFGGMGQTDARTDIYCLGATLYHLVTGMNPCEPPYEIRPICEINPSLSSGFEKIILKCTQKNPDDRYQNAAELMYALEHYNEIDDLYRNKQKRKLGTFIATTAMAVIMSATSGWSYVSAQNKLSENYENILNKATVTEDYYNAIITDPGRTEAYEQLNESLLSDGILSKEDGNCLLQLRTGLEQKQSNGYIRTYQVLDDLKSQNIEGYYQVCYQIGNAFLNYDSSENDIYNYAAMWFKETKRDESDNKEVYIYDDAKIYCEISECLNLIQQLNNSKITQTNKISDAYKELLEKLHELNRISDEYDNIDQKVQSWNVVSKLINDNIEALLSEETESGEVQAILDDIITKIKKQSGEENVKSVVKEELDKLQEFLEQTKVRVDSAKTGGGKS